MIFRNVFDLDNLVYIVEIAKYEIIECRLCENCFFFLKKHTRFRYIQCEELQGNNRLAT